jgi:hypothetical protein
MSCWLQDLVEYEIISRLGQVFGSSKEMMSIVEENYRVWVRHVTILLPLCVCMSLRLSLLLFLFSLTIAYPGPLSPFHMSQGGVECS